MKTYLTQAGFTLIELVIAIVIVTIITTFGIASFTTASRSNATLQKGQEIQSLARKIRTDATAAIKPVSNPYVYTNSCKSLEADQTLDPDLGTVYGSYIVFDSATTYFYGVSCFSSDGSADYSSGSASGAGNTLQTLPSNMTFTAGISRGIYYDFQGNVYSYIGTTKPTYQDVTLDVTSRLAAINAPVKLTISNSTTFVDVFFSSTGLVCTQKSGATPVCAG